MTEMEIGNSTDEPGSGSVAKPLHCTICPKTFVHKSSLEEHILNKHGGDKKFQCTECFETKQLTKSFATQHILTKHIKRVHGPLRFKCTVCFKTFSDASNFSSHKRSHSQEKRYYKCNLCSKAFYFNHQLQIHLFVVHKQKSEGVNYFKCEICSLEFTSRYDLEGHVVQLHVVDKAFECSVCSKTFIDHQTLEKHMKRHDRQNIYFCDICSQGFRHMKSLVNHLGVKHKYFFYCEKCLRSFKNKPDFDEHIFDGSKLELKCYVCQEVINSECNLKIHMDSHVKKIKTEKKDNKIINKIQPLEADIKFKPKSTKDLNSDNFRCELCSKTFDREAYFTAHRRQMHPNAEWKCNFEGCSKTYKVYSQLRIHKMMHAESKEFDCNICQKSFYRADLLNKHKQVHLEEKKYKCEICPKSYANSTALRSHIANNHGGSKPFKCPVVNCGTSCVNNSQLNRHLIFHQTEKSFKCEICLPFRAFKTLTQLKKHQREVHSVAKTFKTLHSRKNPKNKKYSDAVIFACSKAACSFKTWDGKNLALHYNEKHQLPKVLICKNTTLL